MITGEHERAEIHDPIVGVKLGGVMGVYLRNPKPSQGIKP